MVTVELIAGVLAVTAAALLLAGPTVRRRRLSARSPRRVLFPFLGTKVSRTAIDAALRLAQGDAATLVPAYVATVPMRLSLEAAISRECADAMPLLEAIEQRATRLEVPIDTRIERARTPRHGLAELIAHERFDRIVVAAQTSRSDGFAAHDIAWLLEHAPGEVVVLRPDAAAGTRPLATRSRARRGRSVSELSRDPGA